MTIIKQKNIAIDAEWEDLPSGESLFLTTQIAISDDAGKILNYFLFVNEDLANLTNSQIEKYKDVPVNIIPWKLGKVGVVNYFTEFPKDLNVYMFYSPVDYECFFGSDNWRILIENNDVDKKKNIYIRWNKWSYRNLKLSDEIKKCNFNFIDVFGRVSCSLAEAYELMEIDTSNGKDYIKEFNVDKSKMSLFFQEHPKEFMEYSLGDLDLHYLCLKLFIYMDEILDECFGLKDLFTSLKDYPCTIGSLVNQIFIGFLNNKYPELLQKLSYLSTSPSQKKGSKIQKILKSIRKDEDSKTKELLKLKGVIHGLAAGSIPAFFPGNYDRNGGSPYGAVVQGGRTVKEDRVNHKFEHVLDIDIKSAYGTSLSKFDYPFGLPTCISPSNVSLAAPMTLKNILSKYKNELVPGLYVIYVSGFLSKEQDLIISKYGLDTDSIGIKLLANEYEDNDDSFKGRLGGEVILTTQQIELGVITSDVLEVLQKVCNKKEWGEFLKLEVNLLVFYPKSKELSIQEWNEKHKTETDFGINAKNSLIDKRTTYWCRFSLEEFIKPLCDKRRLFKLISKKESQFDTKQKLLKLIINTVYGDLASPYFQIGNTVLANNITAKVRSQVWLMAKALGTKITVTDGGFYEYKNVNSLRTDLAFFFKPGLFKLFKPLFSGYIKSKVLLEDFLLGVTTQEEIDKLAIEHIKEFWGHYDLDFDAEIEHKFENSSKIAITNPFTKVDYYLETYDGKEVLKIRGVKENELDIHPKAEVLRALKENREVRFQVTELKQVLGLHQYLKRIDKTILPGHVIKVQFVYRPNKNGSNLFSTYDAAKKALKAYEKRVSRYEKLYAGFELELIPNFKG